MGIWAAASERMGPSRGSRDLGRSVAERDVSQVLDKARARGADRISLRRVRAFSAISSGHPLRVKIIRTARPSSPHGVMLVI